MSNIILYHGTVYKFGYVSLSYAKDIKDFGKGFYTTTSINQATEWARELYKKTASRDPMEKAKVYSFSLDISLLRSLKTHKFLSVNDAWLDYILKNRRGNETVGDYDLVIGKVADARTQYLIEKYLSGIISRSALIKKLNTERLMDQYCFKSQRAVDILNQYGNMRFKEV